MYKFNSLEKKILESLEIFWDSFLSLRESFQNNELEKIATKEIINENTFLKKKLQELPLKNKKSSNKLALEVKFFKRKEREWVIEKLRNEEEIEFLKKQIEQFSINSNFQQQNLNENELSYKLQIDSLNLKLEKLEYKIIRLQFELGEAKNLLQEKDKELLLYQKISNEISQ